MEEKRDLNGLAEVYFSAAVLQTAMIGQNRESLKVCKRNKDYKEILRIRQLLCVLYRQKRELLETANYLKNYYRFSGVCTKQNAGGVA